MCGCVDSGLDWVDFQEAQYKLFEHRSTWGQAQRICSWFGASLSSIHSASEKQFLASTLRKVYSRKHPIIHKILNVIKYNLQLYVISTLSLCIFMLLHLFFVVFLSSRCQGLRVISGGLDCTHLRTTDDSGGLITLCSTMCPGDLASLVPSLKIASVSTYLHLKVRQCISSFLLSFPPLSKNEFLSLCVNPHI